MKTVGLGIVINGIFKGASAFSSAVNSTNRLDTKIKKLENTKILLAARFGTASKEVTKLNTKITALKSNLTLIGKTKISLKNIEDYRAKFRASFMDKVALGTTIVMPFKVAIDFEEAMADVKKVVNFANDKEAKKFEKSLVSLSTTKKIPLTATELATIAASGGQLGIAKANLLEFTTTVAKMGTAFDMSAEDAGNSIAKLMNVYGLTQKQVVELGDSINHLSDTSASKAREVVDVLGRIGGVSKVFGLTTVQAGALSSAFLALGKPPEVAGTAINALLLKLKTADKQNKSFQSALASIGLSAKGLKKSIENDAQGALTSFLKTLEKIPKSEQMGILSDLFGAEYSDDIALLVGGLENYTKALNNTADETKYLNSMQREFENRSKTTKNNIKLLGNSISSIAINFGSLLLPALNSVLNPIRVIGIGVGNFVSEFPVLSKVIGTVTVGAIALSIGFSAIGYMASFAIGGLLSVGRALLFVNSLFLANPIGFAIAGIAVTAGLIYTYWTPIKGFFSNLWSGIKTTFNTGVTFLSSVFEPIGQAVKAPFEIAFNWLAEKFTWLQNKIKTVISPVTNFFSKVGNKIGNFFKDASSFFTLDGGYKKEEKLNTFNTTTVQNKKEESRTIINTVKPTSLSTSNIDNKKLNKNQNVNIQKIEINNPTSTVEVQKGVEAGLKKSSFSLSDEEL